MSKIAFLFPGQGAQKAGMGQDFYENFACAKEIFDQASQWLSLDMKELCFKKNERLDLTEYTQAALVTTCLAMTAGTTLCISLALYPLAQLLFRLFSSDDAVVAQGVQMMHYLVPVYMTYICIEIFSGALRGAGDTKSPFLITLFSMWGVRILGSFIFVRLLGKDLPWVCAAMCTDNVVRFVLFLARYLQGKWAVTYAQNIRQPKEETVSE